MSEQSPNPLFEGVNKYLVIVLAIFILIVVVELLFMFSQSKQESVKQTTTIIQKGEEIQTNPIQPTRDVAGATSRYNEYFFNNVKSNTAPNNANEQFITVKHKLFKIVNIKTDDGLIINAQPAETTGPVGNLTLSYLKTMEDKFTVWDFTSTSRQEGTINSLKAGQKIWITETVDVKKESYDQAVQTIMIEIVP